MKPRITATIICKNEEKHIRACLESVSWCDEIVVVDSGSTDRTVEIARQFTPKVLHHDWPGFVDQVNFALTQATGDWVLCIDADERCSPGLQEAIGRVLPESDSVGGYQVRRHTWYLGRWINHGGWYPDWKTRVVMRAGAKCVGHGPHYRIVPEGPVRKLDADLLHYTYDTFKDQIQTIDKYSDIFSMEMERDGKRFRLFRALLHPWGKFVGCYFWKLGFLDGWAGFVIAIASAFHVFARYVKLRERTEPRSPSEAR
jgi:glycosyltransferase involved in cell wall biosynthesis